VTVETRLGNDDSVRPLHEKGSLRHDARAPKVG
jgi:hypothetical protein